MRGSRGIIKFINGKPDFQHEVLNDMISELQFRFLMCTKCLSCSNYNFLDILQWISSSNSASLAPPDEMFSNLCPISIFLDFQFKCNLTFNSGRRRQRKLHLRRRNLNNLPLHRRHNFNFRGPLDLAHLNNLFRRFIVPEYPQIRSKQNLQSATSQRVYRLRPTGIFTPKTPEKIADTIVDIFRHTRDFLSF
jgi:hypothetical protein